MNRVDRLHAILVHLQSKRRVTAQELADRFDLSLRTVYRDVKALEESGIPIIGESGIGYSVMEGYRLPPVMFTQEEASSLLLGSKFVQQYTDTTVRKQFDSAMYKIKAVLRGTDKDHVEELDDKIAIRSSPGPIDESLQLHLSSMRKAIVERKVVTIQYSSVYKEEKTERQVEPIGLIYYSQSWHLIGWCRLRKDYRDFRLDHVKQLLVSEEVFDDDAHPSLKEYISQLRKDRELQEVVLSFDRKLAKYIQTQKHYYGFVSQEEKDERVFMRFLTDFPPALARWVLMYTNMVRIESPSSLRKVVCDYLEELNQHYK